MRFLVPAGLDSLRRMIRCLQCCLQSGRCYGNDPEGSLQAKVPRQLRRLVTITEFVQQRSIRAVRVWQQHMCGSHLLCLSQTPECGS